MKVLVRANEWQQSILLQKNVNASIEWFNNKIEENVDAYIDLLYSTDDNIFKHVENKPVFINEVIYNHQLPHNFSRFNGWDIFLEKNKLEIFTNDLNKANSVFNSLGYSLISCNNIIGLIAARNIAMIINEAYFALEDEISNKEQIDIAMKLGTNYPFGPFEWEEKIGKQKIIALLTELSKTDNRYTPCKKLLQ